MFEMQTFYQQPLLFVGSLLVLSLWELFWKGLGLWFSGKNQQKGWFIIMLIFNTMGLLPIIYLIWFKPKDLNLKETESRTNITKITKRSVKKKR